MKSILLLVVLFLSYHSLPQCAATSLQSELPDVQWNEAELQRFLTLPLDQLLGEHGADQVSLLDASVDRSRAASSSSPRSPSKKPAPKQAAPPAAAAPSNAKQTKQTKQKKQTKQTKPAKGNAKADDVPARKVLIDKLSAQETATKYAAYLKANKRKDTPASRAQFAKNRAEIVSLNEKVSKRTRAKVKFRSRGPFAAMDKATFKRNKLNARNPSAYIAKAQQQIKEFDLKFTKRAASTKAAAAPSSKRAAAPSSKRAAATPASSLLTSNKAGRTKSSKRSGRSLVEVDISQTPTGAGQTAGAAGGIGGLAGAQGGVAGSKGGIAGAKGGASGENSGIAGAKGGASGENSGIAGSKGGGTADAFGTIKTDYVDPRFPCSASRQNIDDGYYIRRDAFLYKEPEIPALRAWEKNYDAQIAKIFDMIGFGDAHSIPTLQQLNFTLISQLGYSSKDGSKYLVTGSLEAYRELSAGCGVGFLSAQPNLLSKKSQTQQLQSLGISQQVISDIYAELEGLTVVLQSEGSGLVQQVDDKCGSCWAHSAINVVDHFRSSKVDQLTWDPKLRIHKSSMEFGIPIVPEKISPQPVLNCVKGKHTDGCTGGTPMDALDWLSKNGIGLLIDFPLTDTPGPCVVPTKTKTWSSGEIYSWGWQMVAPACAETGPCNRQALAEIAMMKHLRDGRPPMIAYVDASNWQHYSGGIFPPELCSNTMAAGNHVVMIKGFSTDRQSGIGYWMIENSWGMSWGTQGKIFLPFGFNACGLANFVITGTPFPGYQPTGIPKTVRYDRV